MSEVSEQVEDVRSKYAESVATITKARDSIQKDLVVMDGLLSRTDLSTDEVALLSKFHMAAEKAHTKAEKDLTTINILMGMVETLGSTFDEEEVSNDH